MLSFLIESDMMCRDRLLDIFLCHLFDQVRILEKLVLL